MKSYNFSSLYSYFTFATYKLFWLAYTSVPAPKYVSIFAGSLLLILNPATFKNVLSPLSGKYEISEYSIHFVSLEIAVSKYFGL